MRIEHRNFNFKKPDLINENEYNSLKEILNKNPNFKFDSKISFWEIYGHEIKYRIITPLFIGIFFGVLHNFFKFMFFEIIGYLCLLYLFSLIFLRLIWEWLSFVIYILNYKLYYKKLLTKVKKSNNYSEYRNTTTFWINMQPKT